jgi:hypothetical protein
MSMELHVLSDIQLNSMAEWQRAIDEESYPIQLDADISLISVKGLLPLTLDGRRTGFECYHDDASGTMGFLGLDHFPHRWKFALGFRWRGDIDELQAAWMAATAYVATTAGVIFDHEEATVLTPEQARKMVADILKGRPHFDAIMEEIHKKLAARK